MDASPGAVVSPDRDFPEDWLGYWQGDLEIYSGEGLRQKVPMALDLRPVAGDSSRYHWAIIYGADTVAGRRDYFLQTIDAAQGHYQIDEGNSILLDAYQLGHSLVSAFEVQGNALTTTYRLEGDALLFEVLMYKAKEGRSTGGGMIDSTAVPEVMTYPFGVRQVAVLRQ